jgi:hypothetical protein
MAQHSQTMFCLEGLQSDWLAQKQRRTIQVCTVLISGVLGSLIYGLSPGLLWVPLNALVPRTKFPFDESFGHVAASRLIQGLVFGLAVGLGLPKKIVSVDAVRWSWSDYWRSTSKILLALGFIGPAIWLLFGVSLYLVSGTSDLRHNRLVFFLLILPTGVLGVALICGLIGGIFSGLSFGQIETTAAPNEGMRRSAVNAVWVALTFGLTIAIVSWLIMSVAVGWVEGLHFSLLVVLNGGLWVALAGGLLAGGAACLKHVVLRLWLIGNGSTPWNYVKFLDYAADRILLRKVGGG